MEGVARKLSPAVFVLAIICFFLPFVTFSCQGQKILSLSGIQLVTGTSMQQPQMFGPPQNQKINPEPLAVLGFLSLLVGLGLGFMKGKKGSTASAISSGLGFIFLAAMKSKLDGDAMRQGGGAIQISYEAGYYLSLIFLLAAIGTSVYALLAAKGISLPVLQGAAGSKFCTQCGARNTAADLFCKECGSKFA